MYKRQEYRKVTIGIGGHIHVEVVTEEITLDVYKRQRMYRRIARKNYLALAKAKKRSTKKIRATIRKQLAFIRREDVYKRQINKVLNTTVAFFYLISLL